MATSHWFQAWYFIYPCNVTAAWFLVSTTKWSYDEPLANINPTNQDSSHHLEQTQPVLFVCLFFCLFVCLFVCLFTYTRANPLIHNRWYKNLLYSCVLCRKIALKIRNLLLEGKGGGLAWPEYILYLSVNK